MWRSLARHGETLGPLAGPIGLKISTLTFPHLRSLILRTGSIRHNLSSESRHAQCKSMKILQLSEAATETALSIIPGEELLLSCAVGTGSDSDMTTLACWDLRTHEQICAMQFVLRFVHYATFSTSGRYFMAFSHFNS
jgi:hypothetical protein